MSKNRTKSYALIVVNKETMHFEQCGTKRAAEITGISMREQTRQFCEEKARKIGNKWFTIELWEKGRLLELLENSIKR